MPPKLGEIPSVHRQVLEAALRIVGNDRSAEFRPKQVLALLRLEASRYTDAAIVNHIVSRCCRNAPAHHESRYDYFVRTRFGRYRLVPEVFATAPSAPEQ